MTARRNLLRSVSATSASSQDMFRQLAQIELSRTSLFAQNVDQHILLVLQQRRHTPTGGDRRELQGGIYNSSILISSIHALTILYPSIEGNLGGDIEGRRRGGKGRFGSDSSHLA